MAKTDSSCINMYKKTPWAKTIKKNTNSTQNKSQTHRAKQYEVTSFLSTDCELSTETCSKNVYSLGPLISRCCLGLAISLFCSPVLYLATLTSCTALFTSEHNGISHAKHCWSVIPLPLVRPPLFFKLFKTQSSVSVDTPVQARLLLLATSIPCATCWCTTAGWVLCRPGSV